MRRTLYSTAVVLAMLNASSAARQENRAAPPPDFTGTWTLVSTDGAAFAPFGAQFTVIQDAARITFAAGPFTGARGATTYPLDGSDNRTTSTTVRGDTWTHVSQGRFVSAALLATTKTDAGQTGHWESLIVVSLDAPGKLSLVTSEPVLSTEPVMSTRLFKYEKR